MKQESNKSNLAQGRKGRQGKISNLESQNLNSTSYNAVILLVLPLKSRAIFEREVFQIRAVY